MSIKEPLEQTWSSAGSTFPAQVLQHAELLYPSVVLAALLPADIALIEDADFKKWVDVYAKDEKKFFADFTKAYAKLTENGCKNLEKGGWF